MHERLTIGDLVLVAVVFVLYAPGLVRDRWRRGRACECGHRMDHHRDGRCLYCDCTGGVTAACPTAHRSRRTEDIASPRRAPDTGPDTRTTLAGSASSGT